MSSCNEAVLTDTAARLPAWTKVKLGGFDVFGCRREYPPQITPKMFLLEWSRKEKLEQPQYETVRKLKASHPQKCSPSFLNVTA